MMSKKKEELGKGIRALLRDMDAAEGPSPSPAMTGVNDIPVAAIELNPFQPISEFDRVSLEELAASIRIHGVIQPVTVRRLEAGKFQLISGERRLRASKMAGLTRIPAYVRLANDQEMLEIGLVENIQREDLNPMEIAINYQRLVDECGLQHEELAARVGKNRSTVTNYLRVLRLIPEIQQALRNQDISLGHAKVFSGLNYPVAQLDLFRRCQSMNLNVRQLEKEAAHYKPGKKTTKSTKTPPAVSPELRQLQDQLSSHLSARVRVQSAKNGKGEIVIQFHSEDDLYRIAEMFR